MDIEELMYQMALDLVEADERPAMTGATPPIPTERQWINLDDPHLFEKFKQRVGL